MKAYLNNELGSLSHHFKEWNHIIQDYHELFYENYDSQDPDQYNKVIRVHNIFETILKFFTRYGEFKDSWDFPARINLFPSIFYATVGSEKIGLEFDFGINDYENFFLSTHLIYPYNIKNMNDIFWSHFSELVSFGQFEFLENFWRSSDEVEKSLKKFKNSSSNIFRLIRNYILLELYEGGSADYGSLEIKWPISTSWDIIIKNGASAFKRLYQINYMLYRNEYLRIKMGKRKSAG